MNFSTVEVLKEDLERCKNKIKAYQEKNYSINDITTMVNDRIEYDRLIGEKRTLELTMAKLESDY